MNYILSLKRLKLTYKWIKCIPSSRINFKLFARVIAISLRLPLRWFAGISSLSADSMLKIIFRLNLSMTSKKISKLKNQLFGSFINISAVFHNVINKFAFYGKLLTITSKELLCLNLSMIVGPNSKRIIWINLHSKSLFLTHSSSSTRTSKLSSNHFYNHLSSPKKHISKISTEYLENLKLASNLESKPKPWKLAWK